MNEIYILNSLFKDNQFLIPFYNNDEFEDLDEIELDQTIQAYNKEIAQFQDSTISKIALATFFQKYFVLCDDNIYHFFGKPIVLLTYFQAQLGELGKFFKHVLSQEQKPPQHIINDPEKIIEWYQVGNNAKKLTSTHENSQITSIVGSAEDVKKIAEMQGQEVVSFAQIAAKEGKTRLSKQDLMKILQ